MIRILLALLDLGRPELLPLFRQFKDGDLPIRKEDLPFEPDPDNFQLLWLEAQRAWCPFVFELGPQLDVKIPHRIVPYYEKIPIQPYHEGQEPPDNKRARLYQVHIPAELVSASKLDESQLLRHEDQVRTYWRFALKEFPESLKESWEREVKTFRALDAQSGMIQYYGCYESINENGQPVFGILLEYADFDLNGAISEEEPPVTPTEIKSFYESMHELAATLTSIHRLDIGRRKYDFWHGDIKPENILRVGDHFKLADPGESWIQLASEDGKRLSKAEVYGGTRTYAAPEKASWLDDGDAAPDKIPQNSDVWSLGCVFSIAATYVVLGEQGVIIYDCIRRHAHAKLNTGLVQDVFHVNGQVLEEVKAWHKYLRLTARRGDSITAAMLDMVDSHMLVMPAEKRWEAKEVSDHFGKILQNLEVDAEEAPEVIEKFLRELDLRVEIGQESAKKVNRLDSDMAKRQFKQQQDATEARTTTRPRFKSEAKLLETRIKPTAQRSVHRKDLLKLINQSTPPLPTILSPQTSSQSFPPSPSGLTTPIGLSDTYPLNPEDFTVFQMREELEAVKKDRSLGLFKAFKDRRKSARGAWERSDDLLLQYYKDRDIVFLVDNGSTMKNYWYEAKFVLEVLVWRVLGYDSDGIELFFTNPATKVWVGPSKKQSVDMFLDAMQEARPSRFPTKTTLRPGLSKIMSSHNETQKARTVFILTDGRWEGMPFEEDTERWVKQNLCELAGKDPETLQSPTEESGRRWQDDFEESRSITFQFIAFGRSPLGKRRMKRLDNLMKGEGLPDLIDMEPSTGDAYKMLLGSVARGWDERESAGNELRDASPSRSTETGPSTSLTQVASFGEQGPGASAISIHTTSEGHYSTQGSRLSLASHLATPEMRESARSSLTPSSGDSTPSQTNRARSLQRSTSRRTNDSTRTARKSGIFSGLTRS
ncbi:kinase-like domain-containing protein [Immersiella caudata]|uniref:Kinase-like domain-containing protein n=1 Tax=Immersiella caudata TaxID=314043 RepID=A0AA39XHZ3_9PEZI|nr:kinase-like domain-containing protein [Immersiella caudata]